MKFIKLTGPGNENLYRSPVTGVIYFRIYRKKIGQVDRSTKTTKIPEARRIAESFRAEILGQKKRRGRDRSLRHSSPIPSLLITTAS